MLAIVLRLYVAGSWLHDMQGPWWPSLPVPLGGVVACAGNFRWMRVFRDEMLAA